MKFFFESNFFQSFLSLQTESLKMTEPGGGLEEEESKKQSFCVLLKTWTIYYITLTFALLAIFRFQTILELFFVWLLFSIKDRRE